MSERETVLVVEDEALIRMLVVDVLEELGYATIEAADGAAAAKLLQSDARIDLLISDIGLPGGMDGHQVAATGREARGALKVLFITGHAGNALLGDDPLDAATQVMTKPFAIDDLAAKVGEMLASR